MRCLDLRKSRSKSKSALKVLLFGLSACYLSLAAANAADLNVSRDLVRSISIRIEGATQGTGVLVEKSDDVYTILTAWHVLEPNQDGEIIDLILPTGERYQALSRTRKRLGHSDLGVIQFRSKKLYSTADTSNAYAELQSPLTVAGYPLEDRLSLNISNGILIAAGDLGVDQGYELFYTNSTRSGMSGGPILDGRNRLIGIHGRGEQSYLKTDSNVIIAKTGINQGIPIHHYSGNRKQYWWQFPVDDQNQRLNSIKSQIMISSRHKNRAQTILRLTRKGLDIKDDDFLYSLRASAFSDLGKPLLSIESWNNAIRLNPSIPYYYLARGTEYFTRLNDYEAAESNYREAVSREPDNPLYLSNLGGSLVMQGKDRASTPYLEKALEYEPDSWLAHANLAIARSRLKEPFKAYKHANKSISIDPSNSLPYYILADIVRENYDDATRSIEIYKKIKSLSPASRLEADKKICAFGKSARQKQYVLASCESYLTSLSGSGKSVALILRGQVYAAHGDSNSALADYTRAHQLSPGSYWPLLFRGLELLSRGKVESACRDYRQVTVMTNGDRSFGGKYSLAKVFGDKC